MRERLSVPRDALVSDRSGTIVTALVIDERQKLLVRNELSLHEFPQPGDVFRRIDRCDEGIGIIRVPDVIIAVQAVLKKRKVRQKDVEVLKVEAG
jgi:hypothetical protein